METPTGRWLCTAARLFDGERVLSDQALLIEGGTIRDVLSTAAVPTGLPTLAAPSGTILPGLMDLHIHFTSWQGPLYLAWGVTAVRDVANDTAWILAKRAEAKRHPWPRIYCVGEALDGPNAYWAFCRKCPDATTACTGVRELAGLGVDGIKLYVGLETAWLPEIVTEAQRVDLPLMMHPFDAPGAIDAGVEELFHLDGLLDAVWPAHPAGWLEVWGHPDFPTDPTNRLRLADRIAAAGTIMTPTLHYWHFAHTVRRGNPADPCIPALNMQWLTGMPGYTADPDGAAQYERALAHVREFMGMLIERDVLILAGTDEPFGLLPPGQSLWRELELFTECGMTPILAMKTATSLAADRLRLTDRGRLRPGYAADFVVVNGDPTVRITAVPEIQAVVRDGQVYDPGALQEQSAAYAATIEDELVGMEFRRLATQA